MAEYVSRSDGARTPTLYTPARCDSPLVEGRTSWLRNSSYFLPMQMIRRSLSAIAIGAALVTPLVAASQPAAALRTMLGSPTVMLENGELGQLVDMVPYADGSVAVLEFKETSVSRYSSSGKLLWRAGRAGAGPGEFKLPYRAVVLPDQSLLVFDLGNARVTKLSPEGKYLADYTPDLFLIMNSVVALPSGEIAITGITRDPRGAASAIHIFNSGMQHLRSFGELPETTDRRAAQNAGAGNLSIGQNGELLHTRSYPYQLVRYNVNGKLLSQVTMGVTVDPPERLIETRENGSTVSTRPNASAVRPMPLRQLSPKRFLGGRWAARNMMDLFDETGRLVASMPQPVGWSLVLLDPARRRLIVAAESNDSPTLLQVPLRVER